MNDPSGGYNNFLDYRRREPSNFLWVSRCLNPQLAYRQGSNWTLPHSHKVAVLQSPKIQDLLIKLSKTQSVEIVQLERQVKAILDEIGYNKKIKLLRWLALVLTKICLKVCSGIYINVEKVHQVTSLMGSCPVIFLPSHRSYADFILMSYFCFTYDIAIPAIAAGMDFHGMWGMGTMLRNTGAFFMRRSYNEDNLYWTIFKQYVYQLVTNGDLPIEFFIEGTRSRSNKSLVPKFGLISMVLKAFFFSQVPDIIFVPISISYDRVLEENLFAYELVGVPKPKESTSGFFKSLKIIREHFGNIFFHVCEPISARDFFGDKIDHSIHNMAPQHLQEITEYEKSLIPPLAYEILLKQQNGNVLTVFNLMALVLNNMYMNQIGPFSIPKLVEEVTWSRNLFQKLGAFIHVTDIQDDIKNTFIVHKNIVEINKENQVTLVWNHVHQDKINSLSLKAHSLSDKTLTYSLPFIMLQIYVNPTLHYLIDIAFLSLILERHEGLNANDFYEKYKFFRQLFSHEFITYIPVQKTNFEIALEKALLLDLIKFRDDKYNLEDKKLQAFIHNSIKPFLDSYMLTLNILEQLPSECSEKTIFVNVQRIIENNLNQANFIHPYSLNLDTLSNCLSNLCSVGILKKNTGRIVLYKINHEELTKIKLQFEFYVPRSYLREETILKMQLPNKL